MFWGQTFPSNRFDLPGSAGAATFPGIWRPDPRCALAKPIAVLFVCLGNICRSPLAEAVFRAVVRDAGLADRFEIDSAGTAGYHVGEPADSRTREVARSRDIELTGRARRIEPADLDRFDYILAMDESNLRSIQRLARSSRPGAVVQLLRSFDAEAGDESQVPDPYYGGQGDFEAVQTIVERACRGLLARIQEEHSL